MKMIKIKFKTILFVFVAGMALAACKKDDPIEPDPQENNGPTILNCNSFQQNNPDAILILTNRSAGVDYIIVDCVASVEVDLVIEPGVEIEFSDGTGLHVRQQGSINALGSESEPIVFTGVTKEQGSWKGIITSSQKVKNRFEYVTMEYAGDGGLTSNSEPASLILLGDSYFRLNNVTIMNGLNYGVAAQGLNYNVEINNCHITNCNIPIYAEGNVVSFISGGDFSGNTIDVIRLSTANINGTNHTWKDLGVPYRNANDLTIDGGAKLTIDPGVVIEFEDTKGIVLDKMFDTGSALIAIGTPSNPITFTGVTKVPGAWKAISIRRSTSVQNKIDNVLIEYAGGAGAGGAVEMWVDPVLTVTNTIFKDIDACALYSKYSQTNPNLTESDNTLVDVSGDYICGP